MALTDGSESMREPGALALREFEQLSAELDDGEFDEPPPRPPVEITPLEAPKRFAIPGRRRSRNEDSQRASVSEHSQ
jgi:hypothetical protein